MRRSLIATGLVGGMAVAGMSFGPLAGTAGAAAITGIPTSSDYSPVNPVGSFTSRSGTVPIGVCRATVEARGGNGAASADRDTGRGGDGAIITATYRVTPGAAVEARRHPGGPAQTAGNAGGAGGDAIEVRIGGSSKVFAGGGGGGANNSDDFPPW